jgi:fibronectin-binding autotransporter adhesin
MKTIHRHVHTFVILAFVILTAPLALAQNESWVGGGADQNWSTSANWPGGVVPVAANGVVFTNNAGAATSPGTVDNIVDGGFAGSIASLQFANTNTSGSSGFYHTTQIGAGQTLTVLGNLTVGYSIDVANSQIYAEFTGAGTLAMSNATAGLNVSQGDAGNGCQSTLNLTNLSTFVANIGGITVGAYNTPNQAIARQKGYLYLAQTNIINCIGNAPRAYGNEAQIEVGENLGNGSNIQVPMYLGIMNMINVNTITIGGDKQGSGALLAFNPVFTNGAPLAVFRGTNGPSSRVSVWKLGDNSNQTSTGSSSSGTVDFSNGSLDALVNTMILGEGDGGASSGGDSTSGTFTFNAGTNNVNTLYLGYRAATGGNSHPSGTMNVNGTASLVVNNAICLSYNGGGTTYASGILNINGGTVFAATITNGVAAGANSVANISVTSGLLGITTELGSIGTYEAPVKSLSLSGSILQLPTSTLQTNVEISSLALGGTTNFIAITSIPATIITYPTQIPLIAYSALGGTFNLGLFGSLPGTCQGFISNNTQNSSIDLVLTSGPTSIPSLSWSGAADGNWNMSSLDWLNGSTPAVYSDGDAVLFNDSATGPTDINIVSSVSPTGVTFNNNSLSYSFSGAGISGLGGLTMNGSGAVLFTNSGNTFAGGVAVNSGTVQFGNGGTSGNLPAEGDVLDNGSLVLDHSGNVVVPNTISGTGTLTENGTSALTLTASNSFSGSTLVNGGTLLVDGVLSGTLANAPGSTIGGSGTNSGSVTAGGLVQPSASSGIPSTFTSGALTLSSGASLAFDLSGNNTTSGGGVNDLLAVNGNLNANNNTISLDFQSAPVSGMTWTLVNFTGALTGSFNPSVAGTHFAATLNQSASPITVTLSGSGANLKWDSITNGLWNIGGATNWLNLASSSQDVFYQGDTVIFDDSITGVSNIISIPSGTSVSPTVISNNSSLVNYTIAGPGQVNGAVNIIKQGTSTLTLSSANVNFTGSASVQGGILRGANGNAFGSGGSIVVTNGGTFDFDGNGFGEVPITVSGSGVGGNGAIINSGASQIHAINIVNLSGDTTFGGTGRWDIRYNGSDLGVLGTTDGLSHNITKVGTNIVALVDVTIDPNIGNIDIQGGELGLQLTTASQSSGWFNDTSHTISVENGATLEFNTLGDAYPLFRTVDLNNGSTLLNDAGNNAIYGSVVLQGNDTISVTGGTTPWLFINGLISGSGNLVINGSMPVVLAGNAETYTGSTLINAGTLQLGFAQSADASLAGTANITIAANAILDVSQRTDATLTLATGQTLLGNGTVDGTLVAGPGSTVSAGTNSTAIGLLTVTNDVTLEGDTFMKLNPLAKTNDVITTAGGGAIAYGGTLTLTNVSTSSFAVGNSFKLFTATNYSGAFTSIVPATPGPGLAWSTNTLSGGVLSVVAGQLQPIISSINLSGTNLVISGVNEVQGEQYNLLTSTNLLAPLGTWTVVTTNTFSGGIFSITNSTHANMPQSFYILRVP